MECGPLIYSILPPQDEAKTAYKTLLDEKLVTCCNILPPCIALYPWEGKLTEATEVITFFKAPESHAEDLMDRLREIHPYECPCILKLEAESLTKFANWLACPTTAKD